MYFDRSLSAAYMRDFEILDSIIVKPSPMVLEFDQVLKIIKTTDSLDVISHALATLSNFPQMPDSVLNEILDLSIYSNGCILIQFSLMLGKLAIPKTFPIFYSLRHVSYPGVRDNVTVLLHRFGLESLAGFELIIPHIRLHNGETNLSPYILNFLYKLPRYCIFVCCNGLGLVIPYTPFQFPTAIFDSLAPIPALPAIKKLLKSFGSQQTEIYPR